MYCWSGILKKKKIQRNIFVFVLRSLTMQRFVHGTKVTMRQFFDVRLKKLPLCVFKNLLLFVLVLYKSHKNLPKLSNRPIHHIIIQEEATAASCLKWVFPHLLSSYITTHLGQYEHMLYKSEAYVASALTPLKCYWTQSYALLNI